MITEDTSEMNRKCCK